MSTARFSPADGEKLEDFHWAIASDSKAPSHSPWTHASRLAGRSLVHAKTPWDLFMAIGHGMLGWLMMLKMGFLHRDISIGNVLMLDPPVTEPFGAWTMEQLVAQLRFQDGGEPVAKHVNLLEQMIGEFGSHGKCHGFVVDGDMAARLEDSLTLGDLRERSGTHEFMSQSLVNVLWFPKPYLHSPVDDLESFYYTAQWAVAFGNGGSGKKHDGDGVREFREMISGDKRLLAVGDIRNTHHDVWEEEEYGAFFVNSTALLHPWLEKLEDLRTDWRSLAAQTKKLKNTNTKEHLADNFLVYGYRGVAEYFELLHQHGGSLGRAV